MTRRSKVNKEEFLRLHKEGRSLTELADHFQITRRHATRVRRDLGLTRDNVPGGARRMDDEWRTRAARMLDEGTSFKEIALTLGCDEKTVARHFPGRGWDRTTVATYAKAVKTANIRLRSRGIKPV